MYSEQCTFLLLETLHNVQFTLYISVIRDPAQCTVYTVHFCFLETLHNVQFTLYISVFRDPAQCTVYTVHFCF